MDRTVIIMISYGLLSFVFGAFTQWDQYRFESYEREQIKEECNVITTGQMGKKEVIINVCPGGKIKVTEKE